MPPRPLVPPRVAVLAPHVALGRFDAAEVHLAEAVARLGGLTPGDHDDDLAVLAVAVAAAGLRRRHVCIELAAVDDRLADPDGDDRNRTTAVDEPGWPDPSDWIRALKGHALVATPDTASDAPLRPLVLVEGQVYLQRAWRDETTVRDALVARAEAAASPVTPDQLAARQAALDAHFPASNAPAGPDHAPAGDDRQRQACQVAVTAPLAVVVGGPGTGKTYTIAKVLAVAADLAGGREHLTVALAAPTGKAAARMTEAVRRNGVATEHLPATTIHRLLEMHGSRAPRRNATNPLAHDIVIVDETSMVPLPLMARLLEAMRPDARLVLVGDPFQLASVDVGTVLRDVVGPVVDADSIAGVGHGTDEVGLGERIIRLDRRHRFGEASTIAQLADAMRVGDADAALDLLHAGGDVALIAPDDVAGLDAVTDVVVSHALAQVDAAAAGDDAEALARAEDVKVLAATRRGPRSVRDWSDRIHRRVAAARHEVAHGGEWFVGRPVMVMINDPHTGIANGDTGVVVATDDGPMVAMATGAGPRRLRPSRLGPVETWWAMTIHKSQGSEFDHAVVSLPGHPSPILTREIGYTAVTRARKQVTVVATDADVRAALARPVARASGLRARLWGGR